LLDWDLTALLTQHINANSIGGEKVRKDIRERKGINSGMGTEK